MNRLFPTLLLLLFPVALWGCLDDASRGNPLDPLSDNFDGTGRLEGRVTNTFAPFEGLAGAEVRLTPGPHLAVTDSEGRFAFDRLTLAEPTFATTFTATIIRDGYAITSDTVTVALGQTTAREVRLPGLPFVEGVTLTTIHTTRFWPPPQDVYALQAVALVGDVDGVADVDSVWLVVPDLDFRVPLAADQEAGRYTRSFTEAELPTATLQALQGRAFVVDVLDRSGNVVRSRPTLLARIIETTPAPGMPSGGTLVASNRPELSWTPVRVAFPFTYRVEVWRAINSSIEELFWRQDDIPPTSTTLTVGINLPSGPYNWRLSIVDELGNWSRSVQASFVVP